MKKEYQGTIYRLRDDKTPVKFSELKAAGKKEHIIVVREEDGVRSTLYTLYRPPRHKDESPIEYYKRTGCVDDRYFYKHKGRYYCNPAHCRQTWTNKKKRDEHLDRAYAIL